MNKRAEYFWFRLFKTKGLGPKKLLRIYEIMQRKSISPDDIFGLQSKNEFIELFDDFGSELSKRIDNNDTNEIKLEFQELQENNVSVVYPGSTLLPMSYIRFVDQFGISPILFCSGNTGLLNSTGVSVVGARDVSAKGIQFAEKISKELAQNGINVISGYAKGVDSIAHDSALSAEGTTTMVLSYGILNFSLKKEFRDVNTKRDLLVVSQFIPKDKWRARNAMQRNKLVCALSKGVIVIQSGPEKDRDGKQSGTFNAGKSTLKLGLPLFVVSPNELENDSIAIGNKQLIDLGGIEITTDNAIEKISHSIKAIESDINQIRKFEQIQLFN